MTSESRGGHDEFVGRVGASGPFPTAPLDRLEADPTAAALGRPADQRRLRTERSGAGPGDPPAGGGVG